MDRGAHSLETICLLLALKIEHPKHVHLIRGNHEVSSYQSLLLMLGISIIMACSQTRSSILQ